MKEQIDVAIHTDYIQLDQALKLAGIIMTGGQIKPLLEEGAISLNGQVCTEKRKKLHVGDQVEIAGFGSLFISQEEA